MSNHFNHFNHVLPPRVFFLKETLELPKKKDATCQKKLWEVSAKQREITIQEVKYK
jgi:hypothetical protein